MFTLKLNDMLRKYTNNEICIFNNQFLTTKLNTKYQALLVLELSMTDPLVLERDMFFFLLYF